MILKAIYLLLLLLLVLVLSLENRRPNNPEAELKEARHYKRLEDNKVQCNLCYRECLIEEGSRGFCRIRENINGTLYSLVYGKPVGLQLDPVEMEPVYHLLPGHDNLCVYTASCNFRCKHCQNWHISQKRFEDVRHRKYTPEEVVNEAVTIGCKSISHSINEPTIFYEYMYDIAKAARKEGLKVIFHTNGYIKPEPLRALLEYTDAVTVDLKAFNKEFYREIPQGELDYVLETLKIIKEEGRHLEIVYLVIPGLNDNPEEIERMCSWIKTNLGTEVPLHFNRFFPSYRLTKIQPTPVSTLEKARETAITAGLKFVYIGNVGRHEANHTYCPACGEILIERGHAVVEENKIDHTGKCRYCEEAIAGIWE